MNVHHLDLHPRPKVAVLAYEGLNLFEYAIAMDALRERGDEIGSRWYSLDICAETLPLSGEGGVTIQRGSPLSSLVGAALVVVPGWRMGPVPASICKALKEAYASGARIASICTGAFVLAAAGLLDGRRATTHWRWAQELQDAYPEVRVDPDVLYADEGDIVTSAGGAAGIDMLLHVIRADFGAGEANKVARMMVAPPHRDGGQAQYFDRPVPPAAGTAFARLIDQLRRDPTREYTVDELARLAAMSSRTLFRSFKAATGHTPYEWLLRERIRLAKEMLETTIMTVDQIAYQAGLGSADTMRHHFQRLVGTTPLSYRRTFGHEKASR